MNSIIDHQNQDWVKEIKHTPGPWTPDEIPDGFNSIIIEHEGFPICTVRAMDDVVCELDDEYSAIAEFKGNAELISKAPEMLALLKEMAEVFKKIEKWEMPRSNSYWNGSEMSYAAAFGSNGERSVIKRYAKEALEKYNKLFLE